jgi:hypothetical protein
VSGLIFGVLSDLLGIKAPFISLAVVGVAVFAFYLIKRGTLNSERLSENPAASLL